MEKKGVGGRNRNSISEGNTFSFAKKLEVKKGGYYRIRKYFWRRFAVLMHRRTGGAGQKKRKRNNEKRKKNKCRKGGEKIIVNVKIRTRNGRG